MSLTDIKYDFPVARWAPDATGRMREAAYELFAREGFEAVTSEAIATAAGVTQRTFFRHFPTKEDVLFSERVEIVTELATAVREAPPNANPSELLAAALAHIAEHFEPDREHHRMRASIIASVPALRERELLKRHYLSTTVAKELELRKIPRSRALALAGLGMVVFEAAYSEWVADTKPTSLAKRIDRALIALRADLSR
jgi:AcrR family transcriptional regulator